MPLPSEMLPLHAFLLMVSFVLGTLVGSFCNVCISRWPSGESVVSPRSRCPKCRNGIVWYDNIPILSWLLLGAKCRHCGLPISWQYPLVEAVTGVLFALVYWRFGMVVATPVYMLLCAGLVIATFQDLADWTIPNEITLPGIPVGLGISLIGMAFENTGLRVIDPFTSFFGILLGGGILYLMDRLAVLVLRKPGMGFGDVKLLAMMGAFIGWQGVLGTLMIGSLLGSIIGVTLILMQRRKGSEPVAAVEDVPGHDATVRKTIADEDDLTIGNHYLPFGPYLCVGGIVYLFAGPEMLAAYIGWVQAPMAILLGIVPL